jgi:hypothetical protein
MEERKPAPQETHRELAVNLFNFVWTLLDKPERTLDEEDTMIHAAHASRYHWSLAGTAVNLARGEWQVSRVYAVLGRAEPALYHGRRCLDHCLENSIGDFDLAFAYEALARASAVAGDQTACERYCALAQEAGEKIAEQEDRDLFFSDLATVKTVKPERAS